EHAVEKSDDILDETIAKDASEKLRDDHHSLLPNTGGKSLAALHGLVPDGSAIPSCATTPLIAAFVAHVSDVGPLDSVCGLNFRTCPLHVRSTVADASVLTVVVTTTVDADIADGSKAKDVSKDFKNIGGFYIRWWVNADAAHISRLKKTSTSRSLDTKTMHRVYIPR
nr:hypothetical protein [Tanacetum cinerariifolium]